MINKKILTLIFVVAFVTLLVGCLPTKNQAPIITSDPVKTGEVGKAYIYDVNATDPEEDVLTYSLITNPTGMSIGSATGLIEWTPTAKGVYNVVVKVSDGDLYITQSFTITVIEEEPGVTPPMKNYTITATADTGGSINPSGEVKVKVGSDKEFTITPDANYYIADVLVDEVSKGAVVSYTFNNVKKNHTIHATFNPVPPFVASTTYGVCDDLELPITDITFAGGTHPSTRNWSDTCIDHTVTTVGILFRTEVLKKEGILNAPITLTITDSEGNIMSEEEKLSSCRGYDVSEYWPQLGWMRFYYNGFTFETDVCGWSEGHYFAELTAEVNGYGASYSGGRSMEFDIIQADIDDFDCP
jgi:hypothetical protein